MPSASDTIAMPNVIATIRRAWPVSDATLAELKSCLTPCRFPRKHCLIREGHAEGKAYFIEQGITRSYWMVDGEEITTSFSTEGGIVFSMDELYYGTLSEEYVETIEPVLAYSIPLTELRRLFTSCLDFANWGRVIHQNEYRRLHRSHKEGLTLTARERYAAFRRQFPDVCRRANLGHIASYLGISPSTLSRLRSSFS